MTTINRATAKLIIKNICEGMAIEEIANELSVSQYIVARLFHDQALEENSETKLERLEALAASNAMISGGNLDLKEYSAKQLSKWLIQAGMYPGQIHICTGLSIHKSRHLYKQVKAAFETADPIVPMPQTLAARIVMSIFSSHYSYLADQSETNSVQIANVIVAWARTVDDVANMHIDQLEGFDSRLITLGSLFEVARSLREVKASPSTTVPIKKWKRTQKIERGLCPLCRSHFVYFTGGRRAKSSYCCYCELSQLLEQNKI